MNDNELHYEEIIKEYKNGNLKFSIELSKTRTFLMQDTVYSNKLYVWTFFNYLLTPVLVFILSIVEIGFLGGFIYSIIAFIFCFSIIGTTSINIEQGFTTTVIFVIITVLVDYFFRINLYYALILTIIQYISICYFYKYIGTTFINKFLLTSREWFFKLYGELFYISK